MTTTTTAAGPSPTILFPLSYLNGTLWRSLPAAAVVVLHRARHDVRRLLKVLLVVSQQQTRAVCHRRCRRRHRRHRLAPLATGVQVALDQVGRHRQVRRAAAEERQVRRRLRGIGGRCRCGRRSRRRRRLQQGVLQRVLRREERRGARAADEVSLELLEVGAVQRGRTESP